MLGIVEAENGIIVLERKLEEQGGESVSEAGLRDLKVGCQGRLNTELTLSWSDFANCESELGGMVGPLTNHSQLWLICGIRPLLQDTNSTTTLTLSRNIDEHQPYALV